MEFLARHYEDILLLFIEVYFLCIDENQQPLGALFNLNLKYY